MFNLTGSGQNFNGNSLVDWQDFLDSWAAILRDDSANFLELALLEVDAAVFNQEFVKCFLSLLLCQAQALVPSSLISQLSRVLVSATLSCCLIDSLDESLLQFLRSDLRGALKGPLPSFGLDETFNSSLIIADLIVHISSHAEFLNMAKPLSDNSNNFMDSILHRAKSETKCRLPCLCTPVWVREMVLSDLKIPINGFVIISTLFEHLS